MGLRIRTNVQSLIAQRNLAANTAIVQRTSEKLSSGHRINRAADDAAGFAIAGLIKGDVRSLGQAQRNANDGISLVQVAEGGLEEIGNIMIRLKELSVQSASDTIGNRERSYLNLEFMQLKDEIDRIALSTEFNGTRLLTGNTDLPEELLEDHSLSPLEIQVGKDYFIESDALSQRNPINIIRLNMDRMNALTEGEGSLGLGNAANDDGTRIATKEQAQLTINTIDGAMEKISSYRAELGAAQNRLQSTDQSLGIHMENLSTARSRIIDADFATESAHLTQYNILQQAGAAVLGQANTQPQIALKLLQF